MSDDYCDTLRAEIKELRAELEYAVIQRDALADALSRALKTLEFWEIRHNPGWSGAAPSFSTIGRARAALKAVRS